MGERGIAALAHQEDCIGPSHSPWLRGGTVIFTDLDGSLLDERSHRYVAAIPALLDLKRAGVPVIPVTSKTAAEVRLLREALGLEGPYVVENGGAVILPQPDGTEQRQVFGRAAGEARRFLIRHREPFGLCGFGDMTAQEIATFTGLSREAAHRASLREYTEPFLMTSPARAHELDKLARQEGFRIERGGKLFHLSGQHDKGVAVRWLLADAATQSPTAVRSIGIGDAPNDLSFLAVVNEPITIPRPDGQHLRWPLDRPIWRAPHAGSRGWSAAIRRTLGIPSTEVLRREAASPVNRIA